MLVVLAAGIQPAGQAGVHGRPDPQCTGSQFVSSRDDSHRAAEIMSGWLRLPGFARVRLRERPTWHENPFHDPNWAYQYQSLRWLDVLRRESVRTGSSRMRRRYLFLLRTWLSANPHSERASEDPMAWSDMGVGLRAIELVCAAQVARGAKWLTYAMKEHAAALSDPAEYRGVGNHSLHQDMGLLALGCHARRRDWRDLAILRLRALAARSIDSQGVDDEGSTKYEYLNFRWYLEATHRLKDCGQPAASELAPVRLMPEFLAQATTPDGRLVGLGDSQPLWRVFPLRGTEHEYAVTRGAQGPRPTRTLAIYRRGYLFSRSTWAPRVTSASLLTLRFGQSRSEASHGQDDATDVTFYALGRELLWGDGTYGGSPTDPYRKYVKSPAAQNVVDIPGAAYRRTVRTPLLGHGSTAVYDYATVRSTVFSGYQDRRTVLHVKRGPFLVVDDKISQSVSRHVVQRWQLGEDRLTLVARDRVTTLGAGTNAVLVWVGDHPTLSVVKGRTQPSLDGWRSDRSRRAVPSPTVEASVKAAVIRLTMVLVPIAGGDTGVQVRISEIRTVGGTRTFVVAARGWRYSVRLGDVRASARRL
ncbi:MAG TPA: heparinase II/III family protein [Actinomycetes bacterium]|nr:heparinase II/III family protein [Actinomycetes bacterium]